MIKHFKTFAFAILFALPLLMTSCSKSGNDAPPEEDLKIALEPDPGATVAKALGTSYDFILVIQSKLPAQGVDVSIEYRKDADNSIIFSQTVQTSSASLNIVINNIPFNETGTVTVNVKSKTKATNTSSKTFKLVRK